MAESSAARRIGSGIVGVTVGAIVGPFFIPIFLIDDSIWSYLIKILIGGIIGVTVGSLFRRIGNIFIFGGGIVGVIIIGGIYIFGVVGGGFYTVFGGGICGIIGVTVGSLFRRVSNIFIFGGIVGVAVGGIIGAITSIIGFIVRIVLVGQLVGDHFDTGIGISSIVNNIVFGGIAGVTVGGIVGVTVGAASITVGDMVQGKPERSDARQPRD